MNHEELVSKVLSEKHFEVSFKTDFINTLSQGKVEKVALLVTTEYEGIFKNGGIGTYYKTLSEKLAGEGWYVILLLCYNEKNFGGKSDFPSVKHIFSVGEVENVLNLQPIHSAILSTVKPDFIDFQSFFCLFFTQALVSYFKDSLVFVEFHEMMGVGYRTIQAKKSSLLGRNCITAVTMHSGHEWIYEANERYIEEYPVWLWHVCHYEQSSFEKADLGFFPSYYLKSKVESYGWNGTHAIHMPYFVPLVELHDTPKNNLLEISSEKIPIVFFGRLEERKGLCVFIEAIKLLDSQLKNNIHVIFLGKVVPLQSSQLNHLNSQQYIEQELKNEVFFNIYQNFSSKEAIQFVNELKSSIVCLTSNQENFPNSALEMGQLPVSLIVSDTGGFRETLQLINRSSGVYWFKPRDPNSLFNTITTALSNYPEKALVPDRESLEAVNKDLLIRKINYIEKAVGKESQAKHDELKITVGVTCFNSGKYLMECLSSIETQTYKNIEVIVLDDASTDGYTQEVFNHARSLFTSYKFIKLETNIGLGASRNYLVELAAGKYFLPVDADKVLLPFAVEKFVAAACQSHAAVVTCSKKNFDISHKILNFTGGSLPSVIKRNICGDACSLFSVEFLRRFKHTESKDIRNQEWEIMAAAVATGEKIAYYPYALYEDRVCADSRVNSTSHLKEQYHLRQYLSQIKPSEWSERQIYMLLTATQQLLQSEERSHSQLQQAQSHLEHTQSHLEHTQSQLEHTQSQLEHTQSQLEHTQSQLEHTQSQLEHTQAELWLWQQRAGAMESSKFWKLRKAWFRLKQAAGLAEDE
ncbi:glycosyltransferase [Coleofasciculus sp. FACHB-501]|uniref:glycosyltransferase n=1 Tax=Cyanophyceae TaxID=3028117 RepID=UPI001682066B|nr:glycosyltransferase [Coleofasciculus sp. FACHB-501]MBD1837186.1 glycosyltransferase [Coleofasciculus sp. FACHB-501]